VSERSDRPGFAVPEGSVAVGNRVQLPRGAEPPFTVFINGVEQGEGKDYRVSAGEIVFSRPILKEQRVGFGRWLAMFIGLFGTYRKHETVDVQFRRHGKLELASDLPIHGDRAPSSADAHAGRRH
jgi:hypothetical protein